MPTCTICKQIKKDNEFCIDKRRKAGMSSECRKCHADMVKKWVGQNKERIQEYGKLYEEKNKEKRKKQHQLAYILNKERCLENGKIWRKNNPEKARELSRKSGAKLRKTIKGRLNCIMSSNLRTALKGNKKNRHWEKLVQYTVDQLKNHLESNFTDGMSWNNYGTHWEIDHKIPIAVFNFECPDDIDFRLCWSLKNLRPLEKKVNRMKGKKINIQFQPSLAISSGGPHA